MTLQYRTGDIFQSEMQTLVNAVNTVGVMGKGLALQFKKRYPNMFAEYEALCKSERLAPGTLHLYKAPDHWIINFPTKRHYRAKSERSDIEMGLAKLRLKCTEWEIESMALPALGCGYGGLEWSEVRPLVDKYLGDLTIPIEVYGPRGSDESDTDISVESGSDADTPVQGSLFEIGVDDTE